MMMFFARTFLMLAAAFGVGALAGKLTRPAAQPNGEGNASADTLAIDRTEPLQDDRPPADNDRPDPILAGAIAGETGDEGAGVPLAAAAVGVAADLADARAAGSDSVADAAGNRRSTAPVSLSTLNDGWTVPDDALVPGQGIGEWAEASFKGGGGSAPVHGAPANGDTEQTKLHARQTSPLSSEESARQAFEGPLRLATPRDGRPDDLTLIEGVGPSIERLLFDNGIFHHDQIAAWSKSDAKWADGLTGFDGRAEGERWSEQAMALVARKSS